MARISNPLELVFPDLFFDLSGLLPSGQLFLKLEGFNISGSIKIKSALFMIEDLERQGRAKPGRTTIVESSSGNLGIALALICRLRGYNFICVSDPNITSINRRGIEAYGGRVVIVEKRDANGGYLAARLAYIQQLLSSDRNCVWLNQYANAANKRAHAERTAKEILHEFSCVTHLYVGTGTTGTLMGLAERFSEFSPATELIAVEPEGSVTFDTTQGKRRRIPGIGTSQKPQLADATRLHRIVYIPEIDAIKMCHMLVRRHGLLLGGSTGSVLAAITRDRRRFSNDSLVVAISPDLGDKYLETIYSPEWVQACYGADPAGQEETSDACQQSNTGISPSQGPNVELSPRATQLKTELIQRS